MPITEPRIGIDLGGTKIDAIVFDPQDQIIFQKRVATPRNYDDMVGAIAALVHEAGDGKVGIGSPGSAHPSTGLWRNSNFTNSNGRPLPKDLAQAIGRDIRIENDANCFALSEANDGAGKGYGAVVFFTLGTGLGGGIVIDGKLRRGANAEAGELGHTSLPWMEDFDWPPRPCFCGKNGCAEMYVSGTGLRMDYELVNGVARDGPEIVRLARSGDVLANDALTRMQKRFGRVCANIINTIDPDIFVIGGGLSALPEFVEQMPPLIGPYSFSGTAHVKVARALHGDNSGVRGAARLWDQA